MGSCPVARKGRTVDPSVREKPNFGTLGGLRGCASRKPAADPDLSLLARDLCAGCLL